jgi:hypothetical protein
MARSLSVQAFFILPRPVRSYDWAVQLASALLTNLPEGDGDPDLMKAGNRSLRLPPTRAKKSGRVSACQCELS